MAKDTIELTERTERALLVQVIVGNQPIREADDSLQELERLADTAGAEVVGHITQRRDRPAPGYLIGKGKLEDVREACAHTEADLIIFDNDLTAQQVNNLDIALGLKVIDRTELILQIFARRASSAEAKTQVELAQLEYLVGRLPVSVKQARFTGGIGMKGPGESPLQLKRMPMRRRIAELRRQLEQIQARHARSRGRRPWPNVSLVGYTNAGKSTLLNALATAKAGAYVDDRLFATLDTKTRAARLHSAGRQVLLTDTVGFIRHLPHGLVASFRSTLDVAVEADLLLFVVDASHPFAFEHIEITHETLAEIGAENVPRILVLNKADRKAAAHVMQHAAEHHPNAIPVSAHTRHGLDSLLTAIEKELEQCYPLWQRPSAISAT